MNTDLGLLRLLNPPVNGKIQGLFKAFECFSSSIQGKFYFQGLFKTVLYIQVLLKPVRTLSFLASGNFFQNFKTFTIFFFLADNWPTHKCGQAKSNGPPYIFQSWGHKKHLSFNFPSHFFFIY